MIKISTVENNIMAENNITFYGNRTHTVNIKEKCMFYGIIKANHPMTRTKQRIAVHIHNEKKTVIWVTFTTFFLLTKFHVP